MALYYFKGKNALGQVVEGRIKAKNSVEAGSSLKRDNMTTMIIRRYSFWCQYLFTLQRVLLYLMPIPRSTITTFYYQMAGMLSVDIPIKSAVHIIASHMLNKRMKLILTHVEQQLQRGVSLSQAMCRFKSTFSNGVIQLVDLAGSGKELVAAFRYSDMALSRAALLRRVFMVLLPGLCFFLVFLALFLFIEHRYIKEFHYSLSVFNKQVPQSIIYFEAMIKVIKHDYLVFIPAGIIGFLVVRFLLNAFTKTRYVFHAFLYYLPLVGSYIATVNRERLSLIMANMLSSGMTVQRCLEYGVQVIDNCYLQQRVSNALLMLRQGGSFSEAMLKYKLFASAEVQMLILGEAASNLSETFDRVHKICLLLMERRLTLLMTLLKVIMLAINLIAFVAMIIVIEAIFFYPSS